MHTRGTDHPSAKLTESDVRYLRWCAVERKILRGYSRGKNNSVAKDQRERAKRLTNAALAEEMGVSVQTVEKVVTWRTWRHIEARA
jgi:hypothetical protein